MQEGGIAAPLAGSCQSLLQRFFLPACNCTLPTTDNVIIDGLGFYKGSFEMIFKNGGCILGLF